MTASDRLLIVDFLLPSGKMSPFIGMGSLTLFVIGGTFMRRDDEFYHLLSSAGFKVTDTIATKGPASAIEAVIR